MSITICKATRGSMGRVIRGAEISEAEAVLEYAAGQDVVVCGTDKDANSAVAQRIASAVGRWTRQFPHARTVGPFALPHYQPDPRPPDSHAFYETDKRKAAQNP
jgi:hypothetical protein